MDEYYQQFLSSVAGANNQTMLGSEGTSHSPTSPTAMSASYHNFSYFPGFSEMAISGNVSKAPKGRRKSSSSLAGADAVKHRRTRSGCFTCRSRRVKVSATDAIILICNIYFLFLFLYFCCSILYVCLRLADWLNYSAMRTDRYVSVSCGIPNDLITCNGEIWRY